MKIIVYLLSCLFFISATAQNSTVKVSGIVTHDGYPLQSVEIALKGTTFWVSTNGKGIFAIQGNPGDVLVFSHLGMKPVEVVLEDMTTKLNLKMVRKEVELDEVVVKKRKKRNAVEREIAYDNNPDLIKTQHGIFDTRRSGLSIRMIDGNELNPGSPTFLEAIRGQLNGRITYGSGIYNEDYTNVYLRITSSLMGGQKPAIYDLDGVVLYKPPLFLSMQEIDRIAVIRGIGASGRYGRRGHGGVIAINTKRGKYKNPKLTKKFKDSIIRSRKRAADAFSTTGWNTIVPKNLKELYDSSSENKAIQFYEENKEALTVSPYDVIEIGNYFKNSWVNKMKADELWNSIKKNHSKNAIILKALAYTYEENNDLVSVMQLYQAIAALRPNYMQSYRDLANINTEQGKHQKALKLYAKYVLDREGVQQSGIDSIINIESHHLLAMNKIDLSPEVKGIEETLGFNPIRVVLEWNNGEAEFELQCMNPPNYYTWKHSFASNPERINDEKLKGYSSKQFYLNEELGGKWRFNLNYLGNKSIEPTYLKATIYFDYGKSSQHKELKVFRLLKEDMNMHLLTIDLDTKSITS